MKLQKYKLLDLVSFCIDIDTYSLYPYSIVSDFIQNSKFSYSGIITGVEIINNEESYLVEFSGEDNSTFCIPVKENEICEIIKEEYPWRTNICDYCKYKKHGVCIGEDCMMKNNYYPDQLYIGDSVLFNKKKYKILGMYFYGEVLKLSQILPNNPNYVNSRIRCILEVSCDYENLKNMSSLGLSNFFITRSTHKKTIYYLLSKSNKLYLNDKVYNSFTDEEGAFTRKEEWKRLEEIPRKIFHKVCDYCIYNECKGCRFSKIFFGK